VGAAVRGEEAEGASQRAPPHFELDGAFIDPTIYLKKHPSLDKSDVHLEANKK
jgi:hypothetical protein